MVTLPKEFSLIIEKQYLKDNTISSFFIIRLCLNNSQCLLG